MHSKPMFVLVPGAWHPSAVYSTFLGLIHKAGYPAVVVDLPSLDAKDCAGADCQKDAASIHQQVLPMVENDGKDIIMLCHSYGGIPGGGAAHGLGKRSREKRGLKGGVIGLAYMSAFVVPQGQSLLNYIGGEHPPYVQQHQPSQGLSTFANPRTTLFNDVNPTIAAQFEESLLPHALKAFDSPAPPTAWAEPDFLGKVAFLRCTQDQALPLFLQDMFTEKSGVKWNITNIESSHSPWAGKPEETVKVLKKWAQEFEDKA